MSDEAVKGRLACRVQKSRRVDCNLESARSSSIQTHSAFDLNRVFGFQTQVLQELRCGNTLRVAGAVLQYQERGFAEHTQTLNPTPKTNGMLGSVRNGVNEDTLRWFHASPQ